VTDTGRHVTLALVIAIAVLLVAFVAEPYPQPAGYHAFADTRTLLGVPNFWNVASNSLFLLVGLFGLQRLWQGNLVVLDALRPATIAFFVGIVLTAFGSGWFHLSPDNGTLFWDRLPMTIAFMSLFTIIIGEHVSERLAARMLWPLVAAGAASVVYWDYTESIGAGDLRFYAIVQFLPLLLMPLILLLYPSRFDRTGFLWALLFAYAASKAFELLDASVYTAGNMLSGHTLKHVVAALAPLILVRGMEKRSLT
jgi:hypothetical protein